jgi:hypothetical protein
MQGVLKADARGKKEFAFGIMASETSCQILKEKVLLPIGYGQVCFKGPGGFPLAPSLKVNTM